MKSQDLRSSFVDFFSQRGHTVLPSAPLVPHGDPTLLFTNAGMVQFKGLFLGLEAPSQPRAVTAQKCLRVSGKHNDLENVGPSPRHHTFFEMLGNFSFGDYFKEEAIRFAWDLVRGVWEMPEEHLFATVYEDDDEAWDLWAKISGLPAERILRCGAKDNFWAMGETGPCGPSSEIHIDRAPHLPHVDWEEGAESGRYMELWNLVFMQFDRAEDGTLQPLPNPSIDTGAGLERLAAVLQGVESNYDTDLFQPILQAAADLAGRRYGAEANADVSMRVIADHLRAVSFLLADGVIPSNEGRGYVLRRILRRALRHGLKLGLDEPFLHGLVPTLGEVMGASYGELDATRTASIATIRTEEEKFLATLAAGAHQLQVEIETAAAKGNNVLAGASVFRLYDTFGLPIDVIREMAEEERFRVDEDGFQTALGEQRSRSRAATGSSRKRIMALVQALRESGEIPPTRFEGYGSLELGQAAVLRLVRFVGDGAEVVESLGVGEDGVVVFDRTVFYGEGGGQVGDQGMLRWEGGEAQVLETHKTDGGTFFHVVAVVSGRLEAGAEVGQAVDRARRPATERNHTATHLLHAALGDVLGDGVRQAGSLVAPGRLRFDFTWGRPMTAEEVRRVEDQVNEWIWLAEPIRVAETSHEEAVAAGAMALFGEKYGDRVRTVGVGDFSLELCGGCHVRNSGEIGLFLVLGEKGIASGVRRIEALTGEGALAEIRQRDLRLNSVAEALGVAPERAAEEAAGLRADLKERDKELSKLRLAQVADSDDSSQATVDVEGVQVMVREVPPAPAGELRNMVDTLRSKLGTGVVVVGTREGEKVTLLAAVSADLTGRIQAGKLVKALAAFVGGSGGGRPDFAQAGGKEPEKLGEALAATADEVRKLISP